MKHQIIVVLISLTIFSSNIFAQSPGFNYQAVLCDSEGMPIPNAEVTVNVTLTDGPEGAVLYRVSQTLTRIAGQPIDIKDLQLKKGGIVKYAT